MYVHTRTQTAFRNRRAVYNFDTLRDEYMSVSGLWSLRLTTLNVAAERKSHLVYLYLCHRYCQCWSHVWILYSHTLLRLTLLAKARTFVLSEAIAIRQNECIICIVVLCCVSKALFREFLSWNLSGYKIVRKLLMWLFPASTWTRERETNG